MGALVKMAAPVHPLSLQASQELSMVATPSFPLQLVTLVKHSRSCPQWHTSPVPSCLQQLHRKCHLSKHHLHLGRTSHSSPWARCQKKGGGKKAINP